MNFQKKFKNQKSFYEIWWGKVEISSDQAFWWRYTILNGKKSQASTWGILFDQKKFLTGKNNYDLKLLLDDADSIFKLQENILKDNQAKGRAGDLSWDLDWKDQNRSHFFEPWYIQKLNLAKSHYHSSLMDLRVSGKVSHKNKIINLKENHGVMGHIYGSKMADHWIWVHANHFEGNRGIVFESLAASVKLGFLKTPYLSQFVLFINNKKIVFDSPSSLFFSKNKIIEGDYNFRSENKKYILIGSVRTQKNKTAIVEYEDTDGSKLWCHNTKLGDLKIELVCKKTNQVESLLAKSTVSFEVVDRKKPLEEISL